MGRKILVIDDTRNVQLMLQEYLQNHGFEICLAYDGVEAMEIFHAGGIDLILLDIMMPKMDGYQFLRAYRAERQTPIIIITAREEETDAVLGLDLGADDYITKPFRMRELTARIRAVLRRTEESPEKFERLRAGPIELDQRSHTVTVEGSDVTQTIQVEPLPVATQTCPGLDAVPHITIAISE